MNIKEKILDYLRNEAEKPILDVDLVKVFEIEKSQIGEFFAILDELEREGEVIKTKKKKYGVPERFSLIKGWVQSTQKGFAFVIPDNKEIQDIFIPISELHGAMNKDVVLVKITSTSEVSRKSEGTIVKIVERANYEIVGTYEESQNFGFVIPDEKRLNLDVFVSKKNKSFAKNGDKVVVKVIKWPEGRRNPEGKVIEVLGNKNDIGVDVLSIIKRHRLPEAFPKKVQSEAESVPGEIQASDVEGRRDLRGETIVTIDSADARDLDDAVNVTRLENGNYLLGVHIADVTQYVKEGSRLDKEAFDRGTSVYFVDRVIPMLPRKLSNGICSLNAQVDRLTMSVNMEINSKGDVVAHEIYESVIKTTERMTYTDVSDILEDKMRPGLKKYEPLFDFFRDMEALAAILRRRREKRGMIDFNFPEAKIIVDKAGTPIDIVKEERRVANRIIEEFMLIANETVAEHVFWLELPFVYRIHEVPSEEKIEDFNKFIHNFGYFLKGQHGEVHPKAIQNLLKKVEGEKEEHIINKLMLRSLRQAKYSPSNEGHFGLAAQHYCHFTSPIRRYPDLQIHRILKEMLHDQLTPNRLERLKSIVATTSLQASERERVAEQAERDVEDLKMAEYMIQHVGDEFTGIISSVTSFGVFVELPNTVEGLARINTMDDDYYIYDSEKLILIGERTRNTYRIGDEVKVKVEKVIIEVAEIDFTILEKLSTHEEEEQIEIN